ncbi:hypothetical protein OG252_32265 [Streptomyces sp. NBC_01352]|uniref:hypothetical protein n=1 Tax=Streptomyces sp. NBC_01352 TaxID=2903834 RepID=UPI002E368B4D|nr:hypothetical protein [Streptomyces sp. NBC_01352]
MTASPMFLALVLSLVSAVCYAAAAVVQERTAAGTADLRGALARGSWWWSVVLNGTGALLHVVALRYGPLTLVQPLGALSLVVAVPLGALIARRRTSGTQWRGMALTLAGLITLLTVTASGGAPDDSLRTGEVLVVAVAAVGVIAVLVSFATGRTARAGLAFAAASGIASGAGSTLAQKLAVGATPSWSVALVAVLTAGFAVAGVLLAQKAYRSGLGGPLALLTLVNPLTASAVGISLLGEGFQYGGTGILLALAGAAAAGRGVILLSRPQSGQDALPAHLMGGVDRPRAPRRTTVRAAAPGLRPARVFRSALPSTLPSTLASSGRMGAVTTDITGMSRAL